MIKVRFDRRDLDKIGKVQDAVEQVVVATNVELFTEIVDGTPVDTGFARASWWVAPGAQPGVSPSMGTSENPLPAAQVGPALLDSAGKRIIIANGASYIRDLEYKGTSPQNKGWVTRAAYAYAANFSRNAKIIIAKLGL